MDKLEVFEWVELDQEVEKEIKEINDRVNKRVEEFKKIFIK